MKKSILLLLSIAWLVLPLAAQNDQGLQQKIRDHFKDSAAPGLLVGYADAGEAFTVAFGLADSLKQEPMNEEHLMMSGSTGKIVVSAAILQLARENQLQLDDPLSKHLDASWQEFIPNYECLTIRQLLQHRSGLARYIFTEFKEAVHKDADRHWDAQARLRFIANMEPQFACNQDFAYSDTNYIILGAIIEKVSGQDFYQYAEANIFRPLGIEPFTPTTSRNIPGLANGYASDQDPLGFSGPALDETGKARYNMQFEWTGGGYAYNPSQMARLMVAIFEGKVFGKALLEEYTATLPAPQIHGQYGLGLMKFDMNGKTLYGHSGFFPGYIAQVFYDPQQQCAYVFQINTTRMEAIKKLNGHIKAFFGSNS